MRMDARVRNTHKALKNAMLGLLGEKSVQEISVKELCEKAGISRATFYKHYKDCMDLLEQMEKCMLEGYLRALDLPESLDARQLVTAVYDMVAEHHQLFSVVYAQPRSEVHFQHLIRLSHDPCMCCWQKSLPRAGEAERELLFSFMANGLVYAIMQAYGRYDREKVIGTVEGMMQRCMAPYV